MTVKKVAAGDYGYDIDFVITDENGSTVDISLSTVTFNAIKDGTTAVTGACTGMDASGNCTYTVQSGDFDTEGVYEVELTVTTGTQILTVTGNILDVRSDDATTITTSTIAQEIRDMIEDIPTTVDSGTNIQNWVEKGKIIIQNYTGNTITSSNVEEKYRSALFNIGCVYTLSKMIGTGVDFDVQLGAFRVGKGAKDSPQGKQLQMHADMLNMDLKNIGHKIGSLYAKVLG